MNFSFHRAWLLAGALFLAAPAAAAAAAQGQLRAVLLLEHEQPSAWNDLLRSGLADGARAFNMAAEVIVAQPGPNQRAIFRQACANADLVIVASDNLHEALRDNAANFRRVKFGCVDAGIRASNIMSVTFADEQAAFLAGAAAAMLTKGRNPADMAGKKTVGWLSGRDTPAMRSLFNGFCEGAALVDPETRVIQAVAGSFAAPEAARSKAAWLLDAGADVVAIAAGAGNGTAFAEVSGRGAIAIGLDRADTGLAIVKAADRAVREIMASAAGGNFRGKEIVIYDLANKGVDFTGLPDFLRKAAAPPELARRIGELRGELEKGAIKLHSMRARTLCDCLD